MEKKCISMLMIMFIALTMMPLQAMSESYEACYDRCISSCQIFFEGVDKCIHDCVGTKCHKTHGFGGNGFTGWRLKGCFKKFIHREKYVIKHT
ncbi:unnamed protein product [Brassica rapa subsp. narinosa]|uniref:(rape) hypothetical protein n=1 Tax=Brassica napus TaxID=3708 RepID=A0A816ZQX3_BRANA|nr:unnamed protein product [Brassica napus]